MVNGTISSLHNKDGEVAFPITVAKAIYMDDGNTTLEAEVKKIANQFKNIAIMINTKEELVYYFNNCNHNEHFIINSAITIDGVKMEDKNNITVEFRKIVTQQPTIDDTCSMEHSVSYQPTFHFVNCENLKIINPLINPIYEGICISMCSGEINRGVIDGRGRSKFSGIVVSTNKQFKIKYTIVQNCGTQPSHDGVNRITEYGAGHGIHLSVSSNVTVRSCETYANGANGIYTFASNNFNIVENSCHDNGMSGIQIAFGTINDNTFNIINNKCENNVADGLDINNTTSFGIISCNALIQGNKFKNNGWFNGSLPTQDGSGIGTYVGLSDVDVIGNISENSCRVGCGVGKCKNIKFAENTIKKTKQSDAEGMRIDNSSCVKIINNTIDVSDKIGLDLVGDLDDILIQGNTISSSQMSLSFPHETSYNNVKFNNNTVVSGLSINVKFDMHYNDITVNSNAGCQFWDINDINFTNNKVTSNIHAIRLTNSKRNRIQNNKFSSNDICFFADGTSSNNIIENNFMKSSNGSAIYFLGIDVSDNYLIRNVICGGESANSYRLEPSNCGTTYMDGNIIISGVDENGGNVVKILNWN